ncbi:DUF2628 domain-containing protein [Roseateles sp. BYS180W]|uniref:DUF2628 domain-containing protein n=1 Tax=Roseateles rivi TaxID=3299028 RepID=A0ABW7FZU6_9BURK
MLALRQAPNVGAQAAEPNAWADTMAVLPLAGSNAALLMQQAAKARAAAAQTLEFDVQAWRALVGSQNTESYLQAMRSFHERQSAWRWHWPASLATLPWLLYRKLWWQALAYALMLVVVLGGLAWWWSHHQGQTAVLGVGLALGLATVVLPGLLAYRCYYWHGRACIRAEEQRQLRRHGAINALARRGGTNIGVAVGVCLSLCVLVGVAAEWHSAQLRHKDRDDLTAARALAPALLSKALLDAKALAAPGALDQLPLPTGWPKEVRVRRLDPYSGELTLELPGRGHLYVQPVPGGPNTALLCHSPDIEESLLPAACR